MHAQIEAFDVGERFTPAPFGEAKAADHEAPGEEVDVHAIDAGATAGGRLHAGTISGVRTTTVARTPSVSATQYRRAVDAIFMTEAVAH